MSTADGDRVRASRRRRLRLAVASGCLGLLIVGAALFAGRAHQQEDWAESSSPRSGEADPQPVALETERAVAEATESPIELSVVELAENSVVSGIELELCYDRENPPVTVQTGRDGGIVCPRRPAAVRLLTPNWTMVGEPIAEILKKKRILVFGQVRIEGRIEFDASASPPLDDMIEVRLGIRKVASAGPVRASWARKHRILSTAKRYEVESGRFTILGPRIRGLLVTACAPGHRPAFADVSANAGSESVAVTLRLAAARTVRGVVRSSEGKPVPGARVRAYLSIVGAERAAMLAEMNYWTGRGHVLFRLKSGQLCLQIQCEVTTDDDGRFSWSIPYDGELALVIHADGYRPRTIDLGIDKQDHEIDARIQEVIAKRSVVFSMRSQPLTNQQVALIDVTNTDIQTSVILELDGQGVTTDEWLENGRIYWLVFRPSADSGFSKSSGFLRWSGQERVDLGSIASSPEDLR